MTVSESPVTKPTVSGRIVASYARLYVDDLDAALAALEPLAGVAVEHRFRLPHLGLELGYLGNLLLVAGTPEQLAAVRDIQVTCRVDDLDLLIEAATGLGAEVLRGPVTVPTGSRVAIVRQPGGAVIEYVQAPGASAARNADPAGPEEFSR